MKIFNQWGLWVSFFMVAVSGTFVFAEEGDLPGVENHYHRFELEEFTSMELVLTPDQATRLIFPFVLTNPGFEPDLTFSVTPTEVFRVSKPSDVQDQNVMLLENIQGPEEIRAALNNGGYQPTLGTFFLSVNGYNLSIRLKTSLQPNEQIENVVFDLSDEDRNHLIDLEVARYQEQLNAQLEREREKLDELAQEHAVHYVAQVLNSEPKTNTVRVERISADKNLALYADVIEEYGDAYYALRFELTNDGPKTLFIEDIRHFFVEGEAESALDGYTDCSGRFERGETIRCITVSQDAKWADASRVRTELVTESGIKEVVW